MADAFFEDKDDDEIVRREEARLMRAAARAPVTVSVGGGTNAAGGAAGDDSDDGSDEETAKELRRLGGHLARSAANVRRTEAPVPTPTSAEALKAPAAKKTSQADADAKLAAKLAALDPAAAERVRAAQAALETGQDQQPAAARAPAANPAIFDDPVNPEEVFICQFRMPGQGSAGTVDLQTQQTATEIIITPTPSQYDTEAKLLIEGKNLKVECEHVEVSVEGNKRVEETVGRTNGITLPFQIGVDALNLRPLPTGSLEIHVQKPSL